MEVWTKVQLLAYTIIEHVSDSHFETSYNTILKTLLSAYFPKMKVGLSNHQSVCLCLSECAPH
jgi:hypothetical protein